MCPFGNRGGHWPLRGTGRWGHRPLQVSTAPVGAAISRPPLPGRFAARVAEGIDPYKFPPPGAPQAQKNPVTTVTGFFLAGDEGFEPPQTESESGVLPLHKSPMPSPLKRHLLLYAKIAVCQGLFFSARTCSFSRSSRRIRDRDTGVIPRKDATCRWGTRSITPG